MAKKLSGYCISTYEKPAIHILTSGGSSNYLLLNYTYSILFLIWPFLSDLNYIP